MHMAVTRKAWTVVERDRLPDDGNRYEVVDGELFVTPMPVPRHQVIAQRLFLCLYPYVTKHQIGSVFDSGTDVIFGPRNGVVPDVAVYPVRPERLPKKWVNAPKPILLAEVRSDSTWRRDVGPKRSLYVRRKIPEYWIVDGDDRTVVVVRPGHEDAVITDVLRWRPIELVKALAIDLKEIFA